MADPLLFYRMTHHIYITGGASGIGEAAVRRFAAEGWKVTFSDINTAAGDALAAELGADVLFVKAATRRREEIAAAVGQGTARFGALGAVFANAGIHRRNTLLDIADSELRLLVDTNIYGTVYTLQVAVPEIIKAGGGAVVINASDQSKIGKYHSFGYGMTKGALGQIAKSLALDLAADGVRVNAVCPGTIFTPLVDRLFDRVSADCGRDKAAMLAEEDACHPIGRMGRPEEVADLVYYLTASATFCTGALVSVDGGLTAM